MADREYWAAFDAPDGYGLYGPYLLEEAQFYFPDSPILKLVSGHLFDCYAPGEKPKD